MQNNIILLDTLFGIPCFWWWLLASLGAFLLGWLLDWLFSRQQRAVVVNELEGKIQRLHDQNVKWEADYNGLKYEYEEQEKRLKKIRADLQLCEADKDILKHKLSKAQSGDTTDAPLAVGRNIDEATIENTGIGGGVSTPSVRELPYAKAFSEDNLQIVEGIGPKIETLLKDNGIGNWGALASAKNDRLKTILQEAGSRFKMHDPGAWSHQASLAAAGDWPALIAYQHTLSSGIELTEGGSTPSKVEKMAMKILGFSDNPEDLKIIEGIGPKIESILKEEGIINWSVLAATAVDKLREILANAGERYRLADPGTWPKQADLAAKGNWKELAEYQDYLDGGREPTA